jgi:hypothetical protein
VVPEKLEGRPLRLGAVLDPVEVTAHGGLSTSSFFAVFRQPKP